MTAQVGISKRSKTEDITLSIKTVPTGLGGLMGEEANKIRVLSSFWGDGFTIYDIDSYLEKHGHEYKQTNKDFGFDFCDYLRNRNKLVIIADRLLNLTGYSIQTWGDYEESMKDHETFTKETLAEAAKLRKERHLQRVPEEKPPEEPKEERKGEQLFQLRRITHTFRNPDPEGQLQVKEARVSVALPPKTSSSYVSPWHGFGLVSLSVDVGKEHLSAPISILSELRDFSENFLEFKWSDGRYCLSFYTTFQGEYGTAKFFWRDGKLDDVVLETKTSKSIKSRFPQAFGSQKQKTKK